MRRGADFEAPIRELEDRLAEIRRTSEQLEVELPAEYAELEESLEQLIRRTYSELTPWQRVLIARHLERPQPRAFLDGFCEDWLELTGDRLGSEDKAILTGIGRTADQSVVIVATQKGSTTRERMERNFGMPSPEGYRKAKRAFRLAERFGLPVVTIIDTAGANPTMAAEEAGQSWAIADNLAVLSQLRTPVISIITGEAGSGGALALAVGDRLAMLENSYYSVITPEGCASILWNDAGRAADAAEILKLTAADGKAFGIVDEIIPEPAGGAHRYAPAVIGSVGEWLSRTLAELATVPTERLLADRYDRLRAIGIYNETLPES